MKNLEIRFKCMANDIYLYQVADQMQTPTNKFYLELRKEELEEAQKNSVLSAIDEIIKNRLFPTQRGGLERSQNERENKRILY